MNYLTKKYKENADFRLFANICLIWLGTTIVMMVVALIYNVVTGTDKSYIDLMAVWDAKRYNYMVENGYTYPNDYDGQANWAFFPVYILVCMALKFVTFGVIDTYLIGMVVSSVCIIIAGYFAVKLVGDYRNGMWIPVLLIAGPYGFYFLSMMTEAMFVMFIVLFFYCCKKKNYVLAGVMSALASGTRIVGCLLVFSLIIEMYRDIAKDCKFVEGAKKFVITMLRTPKHILSVLLCPLGAFAYMTFLYFFCGDAWAFKNVQIAWREKDMFPVVEVLWKACTGQMEDWFTFMGWMCLVFIGMYIYMFVKKQYSFATFGLLSLLVALSSHVMSTCRFTIGTFVIYMGIYELLKNVNKKPLWVKGVVALIIAIPSFILLLHWYGSSAWVM